MLCNDASDALRKDSALQAAATAAFGAEMRVQPDDASGACTTPAARLAAGDSEVLITAEADGGGVDADDIAHLSAYFLRNVAGSLQRIDEKRRFADSPASWGKAGEISSARFGADDGMIVRGDRSTEGYSTATAVLFVFRANQIVRLGSIPTDWGNGGAENDEAKVISIHGKLETGLQGDRIRLIYTRAIGRHRSAMTGIWRSDAGTFVLEAGSIPREIIKAFNLPASVVARNGTPVPAMEAIGTPQAEPAGSWGIDDPGLAAPPLAVAEAIRHDPAYPPVCKLLGREMIPSASAQSRTWFVTTANKCDWGAGLGPIWIVALPQSAPATILLNAIERRVTLEEPARDGIRDLLLGGEKGSRAGGDSYHFDGKNYRKQGS